MKNRTVIGVICIVLAVVTVFAVSPLVNRMTEGKTRVVRFTKDIQQGAQITEDGIEVVQIAKNVIPENAIKNPADAVGKYATAKLFQGDVATAGKLSVEMDSAQYALASLKNGKVLMSFTIDSFAAGLSAKLQQGDIISVYVTDKNGETAQPGELHYLRVVTTTTAGGVDENEVQPNEDGSFTLPTTVTVAVSGRQAQLLANYEKDTLVHVALVCRDAFDVGEKYIKKQDDWIAAHPAENGGADNG